MCRFFFFLTQGGAASEMRQQGWISKGAPFACTGRMKRGAVLKCVEGAHGLALGM